MNYVGILTFHCADNYGAMLQAYGLRHCLSEKGVRVDIIDYAPFFMTGRHWWIPYLPEKNILHILKSGLYGWGNNVRKGKSFFAQRANMKRFRNRYLLEKGQKKLMFTHQLKRLPYPSYIVGSDQIWNPDITCGLRKAYFGAFENRNKKRVIAYAASIGGASLPKKYDREFAELLSHVDLISVREKAAISYIKQFYKKEILDVPDPVFLLGKKEWEKIETPPEQKEYIIVCMTEKNDQLLAYARELSRKRGLPVIEVKNGMELAGKEFFADYAAGPSEFLGYIHNAAYVITNSFHAIAFSIIYEKKFAAFGVSRAGERIVNVLNWCGLEERLYQEGKTVEIDAPIHWDDVERRVEKKARLAEAFLMRHVGSGV